MMKKLFARLFKLQQTRINEAGFSLFELLLVVGVIGIVTIGATRMTQSWVDSESANNAGQHMARVTSIVQRFIDARGLDLNTTPDVLDRCAIGDMEWENLCVTLEQEGLLSVPDYVLRSPAGIDLTIAYYNEPDPLNPPERVYRATIMATSALPNRRVLQIARQVGTSGGTVMTTPSNPNPATAQAIGAFGQWVLDVSDLVTPFSCPVTLGQGCVISVVNYTQDELCGAYLYRHPTACLNGNQMFTSLNMNGNDITNAQNLNTENLFVNDQASLGNTNVTGEAHFYGPTEVTAGLNVGGGMNVMGDANFANNVMLNGGTLNVTHMNAHDVTTPAINTNTLDAQNMNIGGAMTVHDNVTVSGSVNVTDPTSSIYATTVNAGTINAAGGNVMVGGMTVQNTMTVTGGMTIDSGTLVIDHLVADDCVRITGDPDGPYGPGC